MKLNVTRANWALVGGIFSLVVLFQWFHFSVYYRQPVNISLLWSLVDWGVWFLLGACAVAYLKKYKTIPWYWGIGFMLLAGPAQIILSSSIYSVLYNTDKTLIESFFHLMNKRWVQNIFISCTLLFAILHFFSPAKRHKPQPKPVNQRLVVEDGSDVFHLDVDNVVALVSARNYVSVFVGDRELVVRDTLKNLQSGLPEERFLQLSRSALVNVSHISALEKYSRSSFRIVLDNGSKLNVGRTFTNSVQQRLQSSREKLHSSL